MKNGWHKARPKAWGISGDDISKAQFAVAFEIVEGPDAGETITWYASLKSEKSVEFATKSLRKCGWKGTSFADVHLSEDPVSIKIEDEEYNGTVSQKVKAIGTGSGGDGFKPMDPKMAKSLAATLEAQVKAADKKMAAMPQQPPAGWGSNGRKPQQREPGDDYDDGAGFP